MRKKWKSRCISSGFYYYVFLHKGAVSAALFTR